MATCSKVNSRLVLQDTVNIRDAEGEGERDGLLRLLRSRETQRHTKGEAVDGKKGACTHCY